MSYYGQKEKVFSHHLFYRVEEGQKVAFTLIKTDAEVELCKEYSTKIGKFGEYAVSGLMHGNTHVTNLHIEREEMQKALGIETDKEKETRVREERSNIAMDYTMKHFDLQKEMQAEMKAFEDSLNLRKVFLDEEVTEELKRELEIQGYVFAKRTKRKKRKYTHYHLKNINTIKREVLYPKKEEIRQEYKPRFDQLSKEVEEQLGACA